MTQGSGNLPIELEAQAVAMISSLREAGWTVSACFYDADHFGNWYTDLCHAGLTIRLAKDRSQYFISGPTEEIKAAGLWRTFDSLDEFQKGHHQMG